MKHLLAIIALAAASGCRMTSVEDVRIVNDDAVYKLGENTVIHNVMYQTRDGEWIMYEKPVLFPAGYFIGKGPED